MTLRVAVHGAAGRMGRSVVRLVLRDDLAELVAAIDAPECGAIGLDAGTLAGCTCAGVPVTSSLLGALERADVAIDFTRSAGAATLARACAQRRVPAVIGTTGLDAEALAAIGSLSGVAPVVVAANMSVGVTVLEHLCARAARLLGDDFDAEIVEMHHRHKADAPSGTAMKIAEVVAAVRGLDVTRALVSARTGGVGARSERREIGVMSLRGGDVVGEHTFVLAGPGERLELTHRAQDRDIFARGATGAAHWVARGREAGRYDMFDVLGIER